MTELFFYLGSFIFLLKMFCMFCFLQTVYFIIKLIEIVYVCFLNFHMTKLLFKKNCPCPPEIAQAFCFVFFCYKSFKSKCKQNSPFIDLFPRRIFFSLPSAVVLNLTSLMYFFFSFILYSYKQVYSIYICK